jgi:hypothetical protein
MSHKTYHMLRAFIIAMVVLWAACKLTGCITDKKALGRVLATPDLVAQVAKTLPPCTNDTTLVSDTSIIVDTKWLPGDTLYKYSRDTVYVFIRDTVVKFKTRTVEKLVTDNRLANQWRDSADKYRNFYISKDESLKKTTTDLTQSKQQGKTRWWIIISLALALAVTNGAWAYAKFKKP